MPRRHQAHSVVRRNARAAARRGLRDQPITLAATHEFDGYDGSGRLKVVPVRDFSFKVPFELSEGKFSYEDAANPVNQLGPVHSAAVPVATSNDFQSFLAAFNKRCNFIQASEPGGDDDISSEMMSEALSFVRSLPDLFKDDPWDENELDRQRWLNKFNEAKRTRMVEAYHELPYCDPEYLGTKDLSVKQEILIKRDDPDWAPRVIYAGNDAFNSVTGPALMIVMERMVALAQHHNENGAQVKVMYAYKKNDVELTNHIMSEPSCQQTVEGDFSRNDREQRSGVATIFDCWLRKLRMPYWLRKLLLDLERFKVQNKRFGFKARLKFQLPTGTTSTTARNSAYNHTMFAVTCKRQRVNGVALILGDDLLARLNRRLTLSLWVKVVADFKMVLKAKDPQLEGEATFLSRRFITDVDQPCMLPLIGKALIRFNCRGTSNEACSDSQYMAGKSLSYAYEFRHVPFMRSYFLKRYRMEDAEAVTLDDLTWFARSSGVSLDNIVSAIENEKVLVSDDDFESWLCSTYNYCTLYELRELCQQTILSAEQVVLDNENIRFFSKDYE